MEYYLILWKYKHLQHMISRFQVNAIYLVETQINSPLTLYTFSIRDKLFRNKEYITMLLHNKQELLGIRKKVNYLLKFLVK